MVGVFDQEPDVRLLSGAVPVGGQEEVVGVEAQLAPFSAEIFFQTDVQTARGPPVRDAPVAGGVVVARHFQREAPRQFEGIRAVEAVI